MCKDCKFCRKEISCGSFCDDDCFRYWRAELAQKLALNPNYLQNSYKDLENLT